MTSAVNLSNSPIVLTKLNSLDAQFNAQLTSILAFDANQDDAIEDAVTKLIADVKLRGDAALIAATNQFDRLKATSITELEINPTEMQQALEGLPTERRQALEFAAQRVRTYHQKQYQECGSSGFSYTETDGTVLGQKVTPLDRVGR